MNSKETLPKFFDYLCKTTHSSRTFDYKIRLEAKYLDHEDENLTLENLEMLPNDYLLMEIREKDTNWIYFNDDIPLVSNCDYCSRNTKLIVKCLCNKVILLFKLKKGLLLYLNLQRKR